MLNKELLLVQAKVPMLTIELNPFSSASVDFADGTTKDVRAEAREVIVTYPCASVRTISVTAGVNSVFLEYCMNIIESRVDGRIEYYAIEDPTKDARISICNDGYIGGSN